MPNLGGHGLRLLEQPHDAGGALERRTIEAAGDLELRAGDLRRQRPHRALDALGVGARDGARVDRGAGLGGHDVGARAAATRRRRSP